MPSQDKIAEIVDRKKRGRKAPPGFNREFDILVSEWQVARTGAGTDDFFPIRAVTLIEVFTRMWVAHLIDHGSPYVERASGLEKSDLKFDLTSVRAIHGHVVTLGDILSHSISLNSFGQVLDVFKLLLGYSLLPLIGKAVDTRTRLADLMKLGGAEPKAAGPPIIKDADEMCKRLTRLFTIRHILCHEFPRKEIYNREEITDFLDAASKFALATNEVLVDMLRGDAPTTTQGMNEAARRELEESDGLMAEVVARLDGLARDSKQRKLLETANKRWFAFREAHCAYRADIARGGSAAEWLSLLAADHLTRARIDDLRDELSQDDD